MASRVLFVLCVFQIVLCVELHKTEGVMDRLSSGMQFAKDFLASESVALKVAEFVVKAFQKTNKPTSTPDRRWPQSDSDSTDTSYGDTTNYSQDNDFGHDVNEPPSPLAPLRHLVRLFGLQQNQISAMAVNALVFVAQMISTFLAGPKRPPKPYRSEDPMEWILNRNSKRLQELIAAAKNESLPDRIEDLIKEKGCEVETSCIRLLICKVTPFIIRMQKAVFGNATIEARVSNELRGAAIMYRHLPNADEINARSDICEKQHRDCDLSE